MLRRRSGSISLFMILTLIAPLGAPTAASAQGRGIVTSIHGLEGVQIDAWTQMLLEGVGSGKTTAELRADLVKILNTVSNDQELFKSIYEGVKSTRLQNAEEYYNLGTLLLELREGFRLRTEVSQRARQDGLFLFELMAEESFYVGSRKFADFPKEAIVNFQLQNNGKSAALRQFAVQTGDVVLSKATGSGSSSFIALSMDHPHIFSHSTPIYVNEKNELLSPEADIEDGVKLRSMQKDYVGNVKTRMFIYRYNGADRNLQTQVEAGMESLISEMYQRTDGDPFTKAAYKYDFSMLPGDALGRGMFCSAVAYEVYGRAGAQGLENPYAKSLWSPVNKGREILLETLNMSAERVPAPGDLELNKNFSLVGARIDITKLRQDRIEMAIVDSFLKLLESNKSSMMSFSQALDKIGNKAIDKNSLKLMAASGVLPKALSDKIAMIDKIPDSINPKQMAFFAFLNEYMVPKIRALMLSQVEASENQGVLVGPLALRAMALEQSRAMQAEVASFIAKISAL